MPEARKPNQSERMLFREYGMNPDEYLVIAKDYESLIIMRKSDGQTGYIRR